jgi:hypothetical protein
MPVYTRPHKRKLRKESRTLPLKGKGDDAGKYFKCWNCGFICDSDRDELGDSESGAGDDHTDYHGLTTIAANPGTSDLVAKQICLGGNQHYQTLQSVLTLDGSNKQINHSHLSDVSRGCPFCGTTNWRGDY